MNAVNFLYHISRFSITQEDWKIMRHALAYSMGLRKILDLLQIPTISEVDSWENEGGAL